jgi:tetratricopeptide (TPR) repeat protein
MDTEPTEPDLENETKCIIEECGFIYTEIKNPQSLRKIYQIFKYGEINDSNADADVNNYLGLYYKYKKDYTTALYYYGRAIDQGSDYAMNNISRICSHVLNDIPLTTHYLEMGIKHGNIISMRSLAYLYHHVKKDIPNAIHYFEMAIDYGDIESMKTLANLYYQTDHSKGLYYYMMYIRCVPDDDDTKRLIEKHFIDNLDLVNYNLYAEELSLPDGVVNRYNRLILDVITNNKIAIDFECINCRQSAKTAYKNCGHYFCIKCFDEECRLCRKIE